jgi:hypothetical protein
MIMQDLARVEAEGGWMRLALRGTALKRDIYLEMGGLGGEYGFFGEIYLAARMWERNYRLVPNYDIWVWHVPDERLALHRMRIRSFVRGQTRFRKASQDCQFIRRYFGSPEGWNESLRAWCAPITYMTRALVSLGGQGEARRTLLGSAATHIGQTARYRFIQPALWRALAQASLWLSTRDWSRDRQVAHFIRFYTKTAAWEYAQCARELVAQLDASKSSLTTVCPTDRDEPTIFGFHEPELLDGHSFRWTDAVAAVLLPPSQVELVCRIQLAGVRIPGYDEIRISLGKHRVKDLTIDMSSASIQFTVPARYFSKSSRNWLILATAPWAAVRSTDRRKLGLPVESISFDAPTVSRHSEPPSMSRVVAMGSFAGSDLAR